jgi:glycosyltransferase involved in cell wall biosynthesis
MGASSRPTVSVVMASFNAAEHIGESVRSALDGGPRDMEVVIQDNRSDDGTLEVLEAFGDPRISVRSEPDAGQSDALNRAFRRSRGEWIVWLNADDLLAPRWYELVAPAIAANPTAEAVFGDWAEVDGAGVVNRHNKVPYLDKKRLLALNQYAFSGATFLRRAVWERYGGLDVGLRMAMDYDFFLRWVPETEAVRVDATLAFFRRHEGSLTTDINWRVVREVGRVRRRHGGYASLDTARPILWNEIKQVVDVSSLPLRKAWRRRHS